MVRSCFRNQRTKERVWDEPPSGASNIKFATNEQRAKAQEKMTELQLTLDMIPPEEGVEVAQEVPAKKEKKGGFFRKFTKKKEKPHYQINESQDVNLQRAIARSMADFHGQSDTDEPVIYFDTESPSQRTPKTKAKRDVADDDDLALAKALSMSETPQRDITSMSEEEQLMYALEQSRVDAQATGLSGVATAAPKHDDLFDFDEPSSPKAILSDDDMDRKMPAVERKNPFESPPASPSKALVSTFDPYSPTFVPSPGSLKPPPASIAADLQSLVMPVTTETRQEGSDDAQSDKPKRSLGRMFGSRRKAMEDEAGVV